MILVLFSKLAGNSKLKVQLNASFSTPNKTFKVTNYKDRHSVTAIWITCTSGTKLSLQKVLLYIKHLPVWFFYPPIVKFAHTSFVRFYAVLAQI